ncbi:hypothetical protein C8F01DRAFT_1345873 [Mycena amicta]|nr:hypothetical protein C8F01DRAFT_1345873 [Mycena amicta]
MIFAVFANPFIRTRPFNWINLPPNSFIQMSRRLMKRFFNVDTAADGDFLKAVTDYISNVGYFSEESFGLGMYAAAYRANPHNVPDLIQLYQFILADTNSLQGRSGFIHLAIHVLTILPNSAGPERIFSEFGSIHTKRRNRLNVDKVHKTAVLRQDRNWAFAAAGQLPKRKLRHYNIAADGEAQEEEEEVTEPAPAPVDEPGNDKPTDDEEMPDATNDTQNGDLEAGLEGNTFENAAEVLVSLSRNENSNGGVEDDNDDLPETIIARSATASSSARPLPSQSNVTASRALPKFTKIRLAELFDYPARGTADENLEFYWHAGRATLDAEDIELEAEQTRMPSDATAE